MGACSGGGGGGIGTTETLTFTQPLAGIVVGSGTAEGSARVDYVLRGESSATTVPVPESATSSEAEVASTLTAIDSIDAQPFQIVTLKGTGFRPADAAISVLFRVSGLEPIVVPAIAATTTTVEVAVPPVIDAAGNNVKARATVQVFQIGQWGYSITKTLDGVTINTLPSLSQDLVSGAVVDGYLSAALNQITTFEESGQGNLPSAFWTRLATLKSDLTDLQGKVREVMADPTATPTVAASGSGTVTLDAASLALADRLIASMLLRLGEGLDFTTTATLPSGATPARAAPACQQATGEKWVDDFLCSRQRYGQDLTAAGRRGIAIGARIETSFYLGIFGGMTTSVLGQIATKAATAFELTWAALSGHLAAWATASEPPSAGQTLGDVGVTILDKLAGTQGILSATYSAVNMGKEYDAVIRAQSARGDFEGVVTGTATETVSGCQWRHSFSVTVTLAEFNGAGTMADPYSGSVTLTGSDRITLVSGSECDAGGDVPITSQSGTVGGSSGKVDITATGTGGSGTFTFHMPGGTHDGNTISGAYLIGSDAFDSAVTGEATLRLK